MNERLKFKLELTADDLSWVSAALSSYVVDNRDREDDYYRLEDQLMEFEKENELRKKETEEELSRLEAEEKPGELEESADSDFSKISVEIDDVDFTDLDEEHIAADVDGHIDAPWLDEYVNFEAEYSASVEVEWEPDGEPTYVPYGDQSVLYDDGRGGLDSVGVGEGDIDEIRWTDERGGDLDDEQVKELLRTDDAGLKKICSWICESVHSDAQDHAERNSDCFERPEYDPEPDYEPW